MRTLIVGDGEGIGFALTKRLLGDGCEVIGVLRRPLESLGDRHSQHTLDVLHPQFRELIAAIVAQARQVDTLVYCAGMGEPFETSGVERDGGGIMRRLD
jgi:NAD(P)-dependent dehydrogenase (short-subunit alcohol dehydrogenase family)